MYMANRFVSQPEEKICSSCHNLMQLNLLLKRAQ